MPHVIAFTNTVRNHLLATVLALVATVAVVLVIALDNGSTDASPVAHSDAARSVPTDAPASKLDESTVAAAIASGSTSSAISRPDEARIAAALTGHGDVGTVARAKAYQEALRNMTPAQLERAFGAK
jgi:hypothetical protein